MACRFPAQTQFNIRDAVNFRLPFPPLEEQSAIAAFLDGALPRVWCAREALAVQIARLREYRQALITAAVTGKLDVSASAAGDGTMATLEAEG